MDFPYSWTAFNRGGRIGGGAVAPLVGMSAVKTAIAQSRGNDAPGFAAAHPGLQLGWSPADCPACDFEMESLMSRRSIALFGVLAFAVALTLRPAAAQTILFEGERIIPGDG